MFSLSLSFLVSSVFIYFFFSSFRAKVQSFDFFELFVFTIGSNYILFQQIDSIDTGRFILFDWIDLSFESRLIDYPLEYFFNNFCRTFREKIRQENIFSIRSVHSKILLFYFDMRYVVVMKKVKNENKTKKITKTQGFAKDKIQFIYFNVLSILCDKFSNNVLRPCCLLRISGMQVFHREPKICKNYINAIFEGRDILGW